MKQYTIQPASEWVANEPGIFAGLSMEQYLSAPGASRSLLRRVAERPSTCMDPSESTEAMQWGTLFNDLVLFGTRNYYVRPDSYEAETKGTKGTQGTTETRPWNGNATVCKEWLRKHQDKPVLRLRGEHSVEWLDGAEMKFAEDARVQELFCTCTLREVSLFARSEEYHFLLKSRPDLLGFPLTSSGETTGRVIYADIKTTTNAGTREFSREVLKFGYYKQAALARQILHRMGYSPFEGYFIIVEKGKKPRVQVRRIAERALDKGDLDLDDEMQIYQRCRQSNIWPDFADEPEPHITGVIDLPEHCYKGEIDQLSGLTEETEEAGTLNA